MFVASKLVLNKFFYTDFILNICQRRCKFQIILEKAQKRITTYVLIVEWNIKQEQFLWYNRIKTKHTLIWCTNVYIYIYVVHNGEYKFEVRELITYYNVEKFLILEIVYANM